MYSGILDTLSAKLGFSIYILAISMKKVLLGALNHRRINTQNKKLFYLCKYFIKFKFFIKQ